MRRVLKASALSAIVGAVLFAGVLVVLTILQHDFMVTLGWDPLNAPTRDWPSGLALGPLGMVMTVTFIWCGLLLMLFALGMFLAFRSTRAGPAAARLLALAGLAMGILAIPTDPTIRSTPATPHGIIHDVDFLFLGAALVASLVVFGFVFRPKKAWSALAVPTWVTAAIVVPSFIAKGITFYLFLLAFLSWCEVTGLRLLRHSILDE